MFFRDAHLFVFKYDMTNQMKRGEKLLSSSFENTHQLWSYATNVRERLKQLNIRVLNISKLDNARV